MYNVRSIVVISMLLHGSIWSALTDDAARPRRLNIAWGASMFSDQLTTPDAYSTTHWNSFGVFGGHGGDFAAKYAAKHMLERYATKGPAAFAEIDAEIEERDPSGTSAMVATMSSKYGGHELRLTWAGDVGAMLFGEGIQPFATHPHRPSCKAERSRMEGAGGVVYIDRDDYRARVACSDPATGGLGVTRALGDRAWPNTIISPNPTTVLCLLNSKYKFFVLGTAAVWDALHPELIEHIVDDILHGDLSAPDLEDVSDEHFSQASGNHEPAKDAARALCHAAYEQGIQGDATAMVVELVWQ